MLLFVTQVSKAHYGKRFPGTEFCLFFFSMFFLFGWMGISAVWVVGWRSVNQFSVNFVSLIRGVVFCCSSRGNSASSECWIPGFWLLF